MSMEQKPSRRRVIGVGTALAAYGAVGQGSVLAQTPAATPSDSLIVTLLGTGSPDPSPVRFGPATLVQAGDLTLLFDAGRGCTIRAAQLGLSAGVVNGVFLTHYHSDHINGLFDLFALGYPNRRPGTVNPAMLKARSGPLRLWGPIGAARVAQGVELTATDDIRIRMADEHVSESKTKIEAHEFDQDGVVFNEAGVTVTAFAVDHGPLVKPACGYRLDYRGRSILISGDTRPNENVIAHGNGVDLMVHSVAAVGESNRDDPASRAMMEHQSSPEDCGMVFARTKPKLAAFTHIITSGTTASAIVPRARAVYAGPMIVGEDLTRFIVGDTVTAQRWSAETAGYLAKDWVAP